MCLFVFLVAIVAVVAVGVVVGHSSTISASPLYVILQHLVTIFCIP